MKVSGPLLNIFQYILIALKLPYNKNKRHITLDEFIQIFNFSEKGLGLVSAPHFWMIFQEKCFSYYILLTDQISLSD